MDPKLARWASRATVMGAIKRARRPGTKLDEMPVLIGDQGIGKSTATAHLLPAEHRSKWFSDALDLAGNKKVKLYPNVGESLRNA
ncbi:MAG: hypothetical protein OXD36_11820 [Rhodobacter sp.]|nr:hypothetical protein [Rhodobacter sp.]